MSDSGKLKKDIITEFSNRHEDGSVVIYRKYRGHNLFKFLEKEDWGSVVETLEEILENKYSQISVKAKCFADSRYGGDEQGKYVYIERIRRINEEKQTNLKSLIERCKNM